MQIRQIKTELASRLTVETIKDPQHEADLLLSACLDKDLSFLIAHPDYELSDTEMSKLDEWTRSRLDNVPLAYLTGKKSFYGLDFIANKNVLIPRPETELIVDTALDVIKKWQDNEIDVIDIGTGSGCVIISIAKNAKDAKDANFYAIDVSEEALEVAKKNSELNNPDTTIRFFKGELLNPVREFLPAARQAGVKDSLIRNSSKILITANLPYLTKEQIDNSPSITHEPRLALDGGKDGMELYIELFKQIDELHKKTGQEIVLLAEIDHTQADIFVKECQKILSDSIIEILKDLGGYERTIKVYLKQIPMDNS